MTRLIRRLRIRHSVVTAALSASIVMTMAGLVAAEPLDPNKVPAPLAPWVDWVMKGHESARCPFFTGSAEQRSCVWPGSLALVLEDRSGSFTQEWQVFAESAVPLPGDSRRCWPQSVRVDGAPVAVVTGGSGPQIRLRPGAHAVTGEFLWDALPEQLQIPPETGILALTLRGQKVDFPSRDEQGRLWLQKTPSVEDSVARLDVVAHRMVADEIPLQITTRVELRVSGRNREALLGKALPSGFVPMSLASPLPARLEPDGHLRVQVRPGSWNLEITARHDGPCSSIALADPAGQWDTEESWVFSSRTDLRIVEVEGVPSIDPQQTQLPEEWKAFPAYLMKPGDTMRFAERRRGDADPTPDRLSLTRELWLDHDGAGFTSHDQVSGTLSRSWRMDVGPETRLGRVAIDGQDQFITALVKDGPAGIELRAGTLAMDADSRIETGRGRIPAVGWNHDFEQVSAALNLPHGWRLLHASGVDRASPSWITVWTLLDLFLVLITSVAIWRLWGPRWGAVACATTMLSWHEAFAPQWIWLLVLAGEALVRVLPEGNFRRGTVYYRLAARIVLVLIALPFAILQARQALYPQLELPWPSPGWGMLAQRAAPMAAAPGVTYKAAPPSTVSDMAIEQAPMAREPRKAAEVVSSMEQKAEQVINYQFYAPDPNARVSTGPGLPTWGWSTVSLSWRGPVLAEQKLRLMLLSPALNRFLSLVRIVLTSSLVLCLFGLPPAALLRRLRTPELPALVVLLGCAVLMLSPGAARADIPTPELLQDLQSRQLEKPSCFPNCAAISRMALIAAPGSLQLRLEIHAAALTAVPLPGGAKQWCPRAVMVDSAQARGLLRTQDGALWVPLVPGAHQILMEGPLPEREAVQIPLPLKPHRVDASVTGWILDGVHEDGLPEDTLQLTRAQTTGGGRAETLQQEALPPFVRITRELVLGLSWQVSTRVERLTPLGAAVMLEVPLLPGESVTSADVRVDKGLALVSMGPQTHAVRWSSVLEPLTRISLLAPKSASWVEVWQVKAGPVWHLEAKGIPPIRLSDQTTSRWLEWRPWPGETVEVAVSRPGAAPGQTLTIDHSALTVAPGLRATDATLDVSLRSSRGGPHVFTLPEGADLRSVSIDGSQQPPRLEGRKVTIPVAPGSHILQVVWREPRGISMRFRTPDVNLGLGSVNSEVSVDMPADRWTLLVGGPRQGPAVLFWSLLAVFLAVSIGLARLELAPLRTAQWFLLGLGLTQVSIAIAAVVVLWLLALGARRRHPPEGRGSFNAAQVGLVLLTAAALLCLFGAIAQGLLGMPDMQISGNESSAGSLRWYQDRAGPSLPTAWAFSVPLLIYRAAMLAWALWIALSLINWLKWGWSCFTSGGEWRGREQRLLSELPAPPSPPGTDKPKGPLAPS